MAALRPVHEQVRDLHGDPVLSGAALRVGGTTSIDRTAATPLTETPRRRSDRRGDGSRRARAGRRDPAGGPAARRAGAARRQVDQPSRAPPRRAGRWGEPDRRRRRRGGRPDDRRPDRAARRRRGARRRRRPAGRLPGRLAGVDGLVEADGVLDCGNSGTTLRLSAGILAGLAATHVLDGDRSLRRRPVARIIEPLRSMGAVLHARRNDSLPPLTVVGRTPLRAIDVTTVVPSAQVKSAILLAGLRADGRTTVREAIATRDHTERMLRARGVPVAHEAIEGGPGSAWSVEGGVRVRAVAERVPADVSAAAFWLVAGVIHPDAELDPPRRRREPDPAGRGRPAPPDGCPDRRDGDRRRGRRRRRRAARRPDRPVERAARHRRRPGGGGGGDRRDPDPVSRGDAGPRAHDDPRRGRAAPQGVRPDRRDRRRADRARGPGRRSRATTSPSTARRPWRAGRPRASTTTAWR